MGPATDESWLEFRQGQGARYFVHKTAICDNPQAQKILKETEKI
jgi:hypothetical protein